MHEWHLILIFGVALGSVPGFLAGRFLRRITMWRVTRHIRNGGEKHYGPFDDRAVADRVALRASEKHPSDIVGVYPN